MVVFCLGLFVIVRAGLSFFFFPGSESPGVSIGVFALLSRFEYGRANKRRDVKTVCVGKAVASSVLNVIK